MRLSAVIPVYGSAAILEDCHKHISVALNDLTPQYEILFRYDCSPDNSLEILDRLAKKDPRVQVFANPSNRGLGYTLRHLFRDARGEYVIYFDADAYQCFDLSVLPNFMGLIQHYDAVVAARYEFSKERIPFYRVYASRIYSRMSKLLFGITVEDIGSGFVLFRKNALDRIELRSDGFDIHIELFAKLQRAGCRVKEVSVNYKHWYGGSFVIFKHGPQVLKETWRVWRELHKRDPRD